MTVEVTGEERFPLYGAREALTQNTVFLRRQIEALESAVCRDPSMALDLCKTLIDTACKTVLSDRGVSYFEGESTQRLLKMALDNVPLGGELDAGDQAAAQSLRKLVGGLQTVVQGICDLRNRHGFASHGKDAYTPQSDMDQAVLAARAADTIVCCLFRYHRRTLGSVPGRRLVFEELGLYNDWIDSQSDVVRVLDMAYRPSEVLYALDAEAYRNYFTEYCQSAVGEEEAAPTLSREGTL